MNRKAKKLREKYMDNPPEGMTLWYTFLQAYHFPELWDLSARKKGDSL